MKKKSTVLFTLFTILFTQNLNLHTQISHKNYDDLWNNRVKSKTIVGEYIYTFEDNGDVKYTTGLGETKTVMFYKAESADKAYYYGKVSLKDIVATSSLISEKYDTEIKLYIGFIIENEILKMASNYDQNYYKRLEKWIIENSYNDGTITETADWQSYPIPKTEEIDFSKLIEIGKLK